MARGLWSKWVCLGRSFLRSQVSLDCADATPDRAVHFFTHARALKHSTASAQRRPVAQRLRFSLGGGGRAQLVQLLWRHPVRDHGQLRPLFLFLAIVVLLGRRQRDQQLHRGLCRERRPSHGLVDLGDGHGCALPSDRRAHGHASHGGVVQRCHFDVHGVHLHPKLLLSPVQQLLHGHGPLEVNRVPHCHAPFARHAHVHRVGRQAGGHVLGAGRQAHGRCGALHRLRYRQHWQGHVDEGVAVVCDGLGAHPPRNSWSPASELRLRQLEQFEPDEANNEGGRRRNCGDDAACDAAGLHHVQLLNAVVASPEVACSSEQRRVQVVVLLERDHGKVTPLRGPKRREAGLQPSRNTAVAAVALGLLHRCQLLVVASDLLVLGHERGDSGRGGCGGKRIHTLLRVRLHLRAKHGSPKPDR
mmetsp:Transcript_24280/g.91653  ORF Transcript_24280/g.91653 Transcript_24280/m.91653 type:complete len:416 (-) Transcript_24280:2413-3660(-)